MALPIIPSTNPTTIPATEALQCKDSFGFLLHFYVPWPWVDQPWSLNGSAANWDAASGVYSPLDTDQTAETDKAQHSFNFPDVRPLIAPTLADGTTPNPQFLPGLAQIMGAVLPLYPVAILLQKTTNALAAANALPDSDTKAATVAAAQSALDAVRKQLGAT